MKKLFLPILLFIVMSIAVAADCVPQEGEYYCYVQQGGQYLSDYDCDCIPDGQDNCPYDYDPTNECGEELPPLEVYADADQTSGDAPLTVHFTCDAEGGDGGAWERAISPENSS